MVPTYVIGRKTVQSKLGQVVAWKFGGFQTRTVNRLSIEQPEGKKKNMEWEEAGRDEVDDWWKELAFTTSKQKLWTKAGSKEERRRAYLGRGQLKWKEETLTLKEQSASLFTSGIGYALFNATSYCSAPYLNDSSRLPSELYM